HRLHLHVPAHGGAAVRARDAAAHDRRARGGAAEIPRVRQRADVVAGETDLRPDVGAVVPGVLDTFRPGRRDRHGFPGPHALSLGRRRPRLRDRLVALAGRLQAQGLRRPLSRPGHGAMASMSGGHDVSVVIPAWNERENLELLLPALREIITALGLRAQIIVADGGSVDGPDQVGPRWGAEVVIQSERGYGGALLAGFARADAPYIVTMDADLSHRPIVLEALW